MFSIGIQEVKMAKFLGLNLAKSRFEWDSSDRLTDLEHLKEDCKILFDGPLADMKESLR